MNIDRASDRLGQPWLRPIRCGYGRRLPDAFQRAGPQGGEEGQGGPEAFPVAAQDVFQIGDDVGIELGRLGQDPAIELLQVARDRGGVGVGGEAASALRLSRGRGLGRGGRIEAELHTVLRPR